MKPVGGAGVVVLSAAECVRTHGIFFGTIDRGAAHTEAMQRAHPFADETEFWMRARAQSQT